MSTTQTKTYFIQFNDRVVVIRCDIPEVFPYIDILFDKLLTFSTGNKPILTQYLITKNTSNHGVDIQCEGVIKHHQSDANPIELAHALMNEIKTDLLYPISDSLVLHSALLSYNKHSILLPGNSGNGKSLLALGLISLGCHYYTDEVTTYEPINNTLTPFERPLMIKNHGLQAAKQIIGQNSDKLIIQGENIHIIPINPLYHHFHPQKTSPIDKHKTDDIPPAKIIVFPCYKKNVPGKVSSLSPAQTMMLLLKNNVTSRNLPNFGMQLLKKMSDSINAVELQYSSFSQLPELFHNIQKIE